METNIQNIVNAKKDEIHFVDSIIKNIKHLEHTYSVGPLKDDKEKNSITYQLKNWECRKTKLEEQLEILELQEGDSVLEDITYFSKYVGGVLDNIEDKKNDVNREHDVPNTTKKEWMTSIQFIEGRTGAFTSKKTVFIDDDIMKRVEGYMLGPVGLFNGKCVAAQTKVFVSLQELKDWVEEESLTSDMVIYMTFEENGKYYWRGDLLNK